jgi:hypothetical protein
MQRSKTGWTGYTYKYTDSTIVYNISMEDEEEDFSLDG